MTRAMQRGPVQPATSGLRWGVLGRESPTVPAQAERGVIRQIDLGIATGKKKYGGEPAKVYREPLVSAYKEKRVTDPITGVVTLRVPRPELYQALADLRAGVIDALIVGELDRMTRDPRTLEDCIEVVKLHGKQIIDLRNTIDLSTDEGRASARARVQAAHAESVAKAERTRAARAYAASMGITTAGSRAFGWDKRVAGWEEIREDEARLWREAAELLLLAGNAATIYDIAQMWYDAGVRTPQGNAWRGQVIRDRLRSPRMAGWSVYDGQIARDIDTGEPVRSINYAGILSDEVWERLVAKLTAHPSNGQRPEGVGAKYLLSGIMTCGDCGGPMYGNSNGDRGGHRYVCQARIPGVSCGGMSIDGPGSDEYITALILDIFSKATQERGPDPFPDAGLLADAIAKKDALFAMGPDEADPADVARLARPLTKRIKELMAAQSKWDRDHPTSAILTAKLASDWPALHLVRRRAVIADTFPQVICGRPSVLGEEAWRRNSRTKHTCGGVQFGRKTPGCPRCDELLAGAEPVRSGHEQPKRPGGRYGPRFDWKRLTPVTPEASPGSPRSAAA